MDAEAAVVIHSREKVQQSVLLGWKRTTNNLLFFHLFFLDLFFFFFEILLLNCPLIEVFIEKKIKVRITAIYVLINQNKK